MGKKGKWFGLKKVFSPDSKDKNSTNDQKPQKSKRKWGFGKQKESDLDSAPLTNAHNPPPVRAPPPPTPVEDMKMSGLGQELEIDSLAFATAAAANAAAVAAQAAAEVVHLTGTGPRFVGKSREEIAAIKIQTMFRGYLARRALRALRGLARLKSLVHGDAVKRQFTTTLRCMQTLARIQSQIRTRRIRMTEENQALQRQLQLKREKELEALKASIGEEWDDSLQSKQQIKLSIASKHEAAIKRERALAYAYTHQWKTTSRSVNPMFTDPNNLSWGWSWLERWMASRPWDNRTSDKEANNDIASVKSFGRNNGLDKNSPGGLRARGNGHPTAINPNSHARAKARPASPRSAMGNSEDDTKSLFSLPDHARKTSLGGSSVRDDESLASSPSVPSYMTPTESARAKSRFQTDNYNTPDKGSVNSVKKRLSFPTERRGISPQAIARRHSGPPKLNVSSVAASSDFGG